MKRELEKLTWSGLCLTAVVLLAGCQNENLFDSKYTPNAYEQSFVVKNVSPDMDWKTTSKATVSVTVDEDNEVLYKVQIFDENPLIAASNAKLLTSGFAKTNQKFETEIDYPTALTTVFVCRIDTAGRRIVAPVVINDGKIEASFVGDTPSSSKASRSIAAAPAFPATPYTVTDITAMLATATEFNKNGDATLNNTTVYPQNYQGNIAIVSLTGNHTGRITSTKNSNYKVRFIITDKSTLSINAWTTIYKNCEIIVANGGTLSINAGITFDEGSLTVMPGGTINGNYGNTMQLWNSAIFYNGGISSLSCNFELKSSVIVNASNCSFTGNNINSGGESFIYNEENATMTLNDIQYAVNTSITNSGLFTANSISGEDQKGKSYTGATIDNACRLVVKNNLQAKNINIHSSSSIECKTFVTVRTGTINMEANSIFYISENASLFKSNIVGPTNGWALLKIKSVLKGEVTQSDNNSTLTEGYIINNIYCELDDQVVGTDRWNAVTGYDWLLAMINGNGNLQKGNPQNSILVGNKQTKIAKFGESPLFIPAGDCTPGNTPTDYVPPVAVTPITYTYAFEDNFPNIGDYDFNDVVMDVKWDEIRNASNAITAITYHVTLVAVGATKELGGGLRLYDVNKSAISSITYGGDATNFQSTLSGVMFYPVANNLFEGNNSDAVIPLFGDAHKVLTGATNRALMLNTSGNKIANADTKTMDITITFNTPQATTPITKENLDFFIAYNTSKQVPTSRNEIHLYEFRDRQSPVGMDNSQYITAAANYPWAISVPEFRYPIERISIISAYEKFESWAQASKAERQQYEDWYKTISSDQKVFR